MSAYLLTILKKELKDIFRDKRSLIMIILPLFAMPAIYSLIANESKLAYNEIAKSIPVAIMQNDSNIIFNDFFQNTNIKLVESQTPFDDLKIGKVLCVIRSTSNENVIIYDETSIKSQYAYKAITNVFESQKQSYIYKFLDSTDIGTKLYERFRYTAITLSEALSLGSGIYTGLLPMIIVLFAFLECTNTSLDLFAGERERGTLELLLITKAYRKDIVLSKILVVTIMSIFSIAASLCGYIVTFLAAPEIAGTNVTATYISLNALFLILIISLIFIFCVSCAFSYISLSVKSVKEGQLVLGFLGFLPAIIGIYSTLFSICDITCLMLTIPVFNVLIVIREILLTFIDYGHIITVVLSYIILSLIFIVLGVHKINDEKTIYIEK